jgi:hypothetical protein
VNRNQRARRSRLATLALTLGAVFTVSILPAVAPVMAAGTATVRIDPAVEPAAGPGASFTVQVISNASGTSSGVQTTVTFDKAVLQITAVTRPATGWGTAQTFVGPTGNLTVAANLAAAIATANGTGRLGTVAANLDPPTTLPTGDQVFLNVTFQVVGCPAAGGPTTIGLDLPVGPADAVVLDGAGDPATVTTTGSTVTPCANNTGNTTTHVTSTLGAGFLSLEVAPNFTIPLIRSVTNTVNVPVKIFSDGSWTLNVSDSMTPAGKAAADRGHMIDAVPTTKRLSTPMQAVSGGPVVTLDQPVANTNVTNGAGTATPVVTLSQLVAAADPAASYRIDLTFTATSGF